MYLIGVSHKDKTEYKACIKVNEIMYHTIKINKIHTMHHVPFLPPNLVVIIFNTLAFFHLYIKLTFIIFNKMYI